MISFSNVTRQHGAQVLFVGASFQLDPGEKVGLVGPNGAGKSTLFRLVMGEETPDEGSVDRPKALSLGMFRQDVGDWSGRTVLAETVDAAGEVAELGRELAGLELRLGDVDADDFDQVLERYGEVQDRFAALGGYDLESRAAAILAGLGLSQSQITGDVGELSGGWKMRVALARILLQRPDVMLLDEPTNHLDIESILWLEAFLRDYPGTVVMTCHDRDVMNRVVGRILEIDGGEIRSYSGDYDFYEAERALHAAQREASYARQQAMLAKEIRFIERFRGQPSKSSQVQSRARKLEKIERIDPPKRFVERDFTFKPCSRSGDEVVKVRALSKAYDDLVVHDGLDLLVRRGERWAVMGENGAGKSTLLRMMAGVTQPDAGTAELGSSVKLGYFAQHHTENLTEGHTVLDEVQAAFPTTGLGVLKGLLGGFSFGEDDFDKPISVLSGGERTRVALAKLLYANPNLLILDEPTNHLDLATKRALIRALSAFEGTMVFVSHDRAFLRALADHVLELVPGDPRLYPGTYAEYVQTSGHDAPGMRKL
ncbi:MAG: ABC-F family ATP-binding cassette domain-containing protein [Deltaproteobacteria bacterium]|nr:MAG: ABC-F family ATP-binding cassette domain-containing protein [Deltaproteobacteria bacterium]